MPSPDESQEGKVIVLRRPVNSPKPTIHKSVSAHFPDWDKPLKRWEPLDTSTTNRTPDAKDISDTSKFPAKGDHTHSVTQHPEPIPIEELLAPSKEQQWQPSQKIYRPPPKIDRPPPPKPPPKPQPASVRRFSEGIEL